MESAGRTVAAFDERPTLSAIDQYYLLAFNFLSSSRSSGMGLSGILLSECLAYHEVFGSPHQIDSFCRIIRLIDNKFIEAHHKEQERKSKLKHK